MCVVEAGEISAHSKWMYITPLVHTINLVASLFSYARLLFPILTNQIIFGLRLWLAYHHTTVLPILLKITNAQFKNGMRLGLGKFLLISALSSCG